MAVHLARQPRAPQLVRPGGGERHDDPGRRARLRPQHKHPGGPLRNFTAGKDTVETQGANVGEVLNNVKSSAPGIETRLFKAPNQLNRFVNVYLNDEDIRYLKNLETPVKEGDEISIVPAIAGGR